MSDENEQPKGIGDTALPPIPLTPKMEWVCARLDAHYIQQRFKKSSPSNMLRGAIFAARLELRHHNPDWLAQAAHSLRDILYPYLAKKGALGIPKTIQLFKDYGSVKNPEETIERINKLFVELTRISHHDQKDPRSFEALLADFEAGMADVLSRQSDIHTEIDDLLSLDPNV